MRAGFSLLYREIHYIEVRYIEVWVYYNGCTLDSDNKADDAFETKYGIEPSYIVCKVVTKYIFII